MSHDFAIIEGSYNLRDRAVEQQIKVAMAWQIKQRFSQAIASYQKAIQLQPNGTDGRG
jgi:hypothetical protein